MLVRLYPGVEKTYLGSSQMILQKDEHHGCGSVYVLILIYLGYWIRIRNPDPGGHNDQQK